MSERRVAIITHGDSTIGAGIMTEFAKSGYRVSIIGTDVDILNSAVNESIEVSRTKNRLDFLPIRADLNQDGEIKSIITKTVDRFGRIDVLVSNSGLINKQLSLGNDDFYENFRNEMKKNLIIPIRLSREVMPYLIASRGVFISINSRSDDLEPDISYNVSKAGIHMLSKTFANAVDSSGVRSIAISLGQKSLDTKIKANSPNDTNVRENFGEIVSFVVFLASDEASFIHGSTIDFDSPMR